MHPEYIAAALYKADLLEVIQRYTALSPDITFESDGEQVITVVCDSLKPEEFADADELGAWLLLKKQVGDYFSALSLAGGDWRTLASFVVDENRLLYGSKADRLRIVNLAGQVLPPDITAFMKCCVDEDA
jgi:hypothetical protein